MNRTDLIILATQIFGGIADGQTGNLVYFRGDYIDIRANRFLRFLIKDGYKAKELGLGYKTTIGRWIIIN